MIVPWAQIDKKKKKKAEKNFSLPAKAKLYVEWLMSAYMGLGDVINMTYNVSY